MNTNAYLGSSFPRRRERSTTKTRSKIWENKKYLSTNKCGASAEVTSANISQKKQKVSLGCVLMYGRSSELFGYNKKRKRNKSVYSRRLFSELSVNISDGDIRDSDSNWLSANDILSSYSTTLSRSPSWPPMNDSKDLLRLRSECGGARSSLHSDDNDSSNCSVSTSPSSEGHNFHLSRFADINEQQASTKDDESLQSHLSSASTEPNTSCNGNVSEETAITSFKQIFPRITSSSEAAMRMSRSENGKLEYALPENTEHFDNSGFSLLRHLELQNNNSMIEDKGNFTTCGAQSSSRSTSTNIIPASSSHIGISGGLGDTPTEEDQVPFEEDQGQLTKSRKFEKSNGSQTIEPRPLRCFFNALWPEQFCVNQGRKKFRACAGPGWNTIHHLKEHLKSHHKSKAKPLKCNRCQIEFKDQSLLEDHEMIIDCVIRCPDCEEEFEKKSMRRSHQQEAHRQDTEDSILLEYNESMEKLIKDQIKAYVDSLKKGKARSDVALEHWVDNNIAQYQVGRFAKHNPRLELGQWYIMCRILSELGPNGKIPDHPFYNYGKTHSELVAEKILLIYESTIDTKLRVLGPPPSNLQDQRDWYKNNLRESLQIAAETRLIPPSTHDSSSMVPEHPEFLQSTTSGSTVPSYDIYQFPNMPNAGEHFNGHFGIDNLGTIDDNNSMDSMNLPQDFISNRPQYPSNWHMQHRQ